MSAMPPTICWCCLRNLGDYDCGMCYDCYTWVERQFELNGKTEHEIHKAWRAAHPEALEAPHEEGAP